MKIISVILTEAIVLIIALNTESVSLANHVSQIFLAVLCHEGGHIIAADLLGMNTNSFRFYPIGIKMNFSSECYSKCYSSFKSVCVCLAGCLFGFLSAGVIYFSPVDNLEVFIFTSISLSIVNLLPIKCFDGGEILDILMNNAFFPDTAQRITQTVSATAVLLFWLLTVTFQMKYGINLVMMVFALYLLYISL